MSASPDAANQTIHTLNSDMVYFDQIIEAVKACNLDIEVVEPQVFYTKLVEAAQNRAVDGILPFVEFFKPLPGSSFVTGRDGRLGAGNYYGNARLQKLMRGKHIRLDHIDDYLKRCIDKFLEEKL